MSDGIHPAKTLSATHLEVARAVFQGRKAKLGAPEAPTKAGLLALAKRGHEVWNAWRAAYPNPIADFSGVDFRHEPVDFSGFTFSSGGRDVENGEFTSCVDFSNASFGVETSFKGASFEDMARFDGANFGVGVSFKDTSFDVMASFAGASFGAWAIFENASFGTGTNFNGASFGDGAFFNGVSFGSGTSFEGASLGNRALFMGASFRGEVNFKGADFGAGVLFDGATFEGSTDFAALSLKETEEFWRRIGYTEKLIAARKAEAEAPRIMSDAFKIISFTGVSFRGNVSFQNRRFLDAADFGVTNVDIVTLLRPSGERRVVSGGTPTRFFGVPNFHGCALHQNTSFDGAEFKAPPSPEAARAYRTLKLAFAQQHALREEQRFFRLEMQAEAGTAGFPRKQLFWLYETCADYGFSLRRPIGLWLISLVVLGALYGLQIASPFILKDGQQINWPVMFQWVQYTLINAVPLPGSELTLKELREPLFGSTAPSLWLTVLEMLHKTISLVSLFLVGLALRNLFKLKS